MTCFIIIKKKKIKEKCLGHYKFYYNFLTVSYDSILMVKKIKQQNLTDKFNFLVADVVSAT